MFTDETIVFPRGFLLSLSEVEAPPTFIAGPILPNFFIHPWAEVDHAGDQNSFVIVIGNLLSTSAECDRYPAEELLRLLKSDEGTFLEALALSGGRHAVLFGSQSQIRVVNDATSMRSVFYAGTGGIIASHAILVERALGGTVTRSSMPFQYGYPGNRTPFQRTKILTPNNSYCLNFNTLERFWPTKEIAEKTVEEVAQESLTRATTLFQNMARNRDMKMALTAGLDSRVILAVGLNSGVEFEAYTYGNADNTLTDRNFAVELAEKFKVKHSLIPRPEMPPKINRNVSEAHYSPHHKNVVGGLIEWFQDARGVSVTGNLLEIGRSFYAARKHEGYASPETAEAMVKIHHRSMTKHVRQILDEYSYDRYSDVATLAFQTFIEETDFEKGCQWIDPFDLFYWEHRMATWHGTNMVERDFYAEAFIPFNSRSIFESMLGVPQKQRDDSSVFYEMIRLVDPSLLDMPINPKSWPA